MNIKQIVSRVNHKLLYLDIDINDMLDIIYLIDIKQELEIWQRLWNKTQLQEYIDNYKGKKNATFLKQFALLIKFDTVWNNKWYYKNDNGMWVPVNDISNDIKWMLLRIGIGE